jgi:hypothetical protein
MPAIYQRRPGNRKVDAERRQWQAGNGDKFAGAASAKAFGFLNNMQ